MAAIVKSASKSATDERLRRLTLQVMAGEMAQNVGKRIRAARLAKFHNGKPWTQRQLVAALGINPPPESQRASEWELGKHLPSEDTMQRIAAALDKPVAWFYEGDVDLPTPDLSAALNGGASQLDRIEAKLDRAIQAQAEIQAVLVKLTREPARTQVKRATASAAERAKKRRAKAPGDRDDRQAGGQAS